MASTQVAFVNVDVVESNRENFEAASQKNISESVKEPDNLRFDLLRSKDDPTKYVLLEVYGTEQGPKDHKQTEHYLVWKEGVAEMMANPRKGVQYALHSPAPQYLQSFWNTAPANWPECGPMDVTLVHVHVKEGTEEAFSTASSANAAASVKEPGNLRFDVYQEKEDPTRFILLEVYQSAEEAAKHKETGHYKTWRETVADMMAEPRQGKKYTPVGEEQPWKWAVPPVLSGKAPPTPSLKVPGLKLIDGQQMPALGFGCYKVGVIPGSAAGAASAAKPTTPARSVVADALAAGYRCFDCAQFYENEVQIGAVFNASAIERSELYIISKVWTNKIYEGPEAVRAQCLQSIKDLQCGYLDLYMVHWPVPGKHVEAYKAIVELQKEGLVKSVGVSNYTIEDLAQLQAAGLPLPAVNQIEINPFLYRKKTIEHFQGLGIQLQAYRALCNFGSSASLENSSVNEIAAKHKRPASQVLGRWCIQKGFQHIPKSEKRARMDENAQVLDWELDVQDMEKLDSLTPSVNLEKFKNTYLKGIVRDTPLQNDFDAAKVEITVA